MGARFYKIIYEVYPLFATLSLPDTFEYNSLKNNKKFRKLGNRNQTDGEKMIQNHLGKTVAQQTLT